MNKTNVKICGISHPQDIEVVNIEKPTFIGFVFTKSRREVTPQQAWKLRKMLHADIIPVGVFVDEAVEKVVALVKNKTIEMIQLHGSEDENYIGKLKAVTDVAIIKAVTIENAGDAQKWEKSLADYLLFDHQGGGTGACFNWDLIGNVHKPFFLAGGLQPQNVRLAIQKTTPFAVDVSSGVETNGLKDPKKISEFIRRVNDED